MFTQCRGCGEIFKVLVDDLVTASGMVRCSSCGTVFNALDTLSEYKPQESSDLILHENDNSPPLLTHEHKKSVVKESVQNTVKNSDSQDSDDQEFDNQDSLNETLDLQTQTIQEDDTEVLNIKPEFVTDVEPKKQKSLLLWVFLTLAFLAGLLWQASIAIKNGSLVLPEGELKQKICEQIECYARIEQSNLNKIALVSRSIRQHPGRDNALIITTGIINSDNKVQMFPALQVKMSNLNGEIVAMRRFLPSEYIDEKIIESGMLPNTLIPVTLELQSPGQNAVTFEVGFSPTFGEN